MDLAETQTKKKVTTTIIGITLLGVIIFKFIGCGRLPPEKFWTGDESDSLRVKSVIAYYDTAPGWQNFLSQLDFEGTLDTIKLNRTRVFPTSEVSSLEFRIKQAYLPSRLAIELNSKKTDTNLIFTYDTTATVELITKIKGVARIGCDSVRRYLKDTIIGTDTLMLFDAWTAKSFLRDSVIRGETVLVYDTLALGKDSIVLVKGFEGRVWRSLYFEPEDKSSSPRVWQLKKISGGASVRIPDSEDDAPYIYYAFFREKGKVKTDTWYNRPDTIHYGISRLYPFPDSIWSYGVDKDTVDSLEIAALYTILNPSDTALYFAYSDHYYSLRGLGSDARLLLSEVRFGEKIGLLSLIVCPRQSLIYKKDPFKLRVWQIPVRLK